VARKRQQWRLTQQALADAIGVGRDTIARIEAGTHAPSLCVLVALATLFGMRTDRLLCLDDVEDLSGAPPVQRKPRIMPHQVYQAWGARRQQIARS
jgi:DNA-binding XRE family transcriptional regulator